MRRIEHSLTPCVALLRGINVGQARRVAMADLRLVLESVGALEVRTLLNSGNAVFQAPEPAIAGLGTVIEAAIRERFGFAVPVTVHTAEEWATIIAENPLPQAATDLSRFLVAFGIPATAHGEIRALLETSWAPEALAVGRKAAYLWCASGIIASPLLRALTRCAGAAVTTRNWATVLKLQDALAQGQRSP